MKGFFDKIKFGWKYLASVIFAVGAVFAAYSVLPLKELPKSLQPEIGTVYLVVGDSGEGNEDQAQVANAIKKRQQSGIKYSKALHLGDVIYENGLSSANDKQYEQKFAKYYRPLGLSFYMTMGNHDYQGNPDSWLEISRRENWVYFPSYFYAWKEGSVCFAGIDTEPLDRYQGKSKKDIKEKVTQQLSWLKKTTDEDFNDCTFTIAFGHHPCFSSGDHGDANDHYETVCNNYLIGKFDAILNGHDHQLSYEGSHKGTHQFVSGGGGGGLRTFKRDPVWGVEKLGFMEITYLGPKVMKFSFYVAEKSGPVLAYEKIVDKNAVVVVPPPSRPEEPKEENRWRSPSQNARYQILKEDDGDYLRQLKNGTSIVVIEAVKEDYSDLKEEIDELHAANVLVSCYHSLSYEPWRHDIKNFPSKAKGKKMAGWNEWWSDTRPNSPAHAFWDARYDEFAKAGCDCVEDDNEVDSGDNETGFPLSKRESADSNFRRAAAAHARGMCHIAKNNPGMSSDYAQNSDGVMIEESAKYGEREDYLPWKEAGKFAAMIEYSSSGCKPYPGFSVQYHSDGDYFSGINYKVCD